MQLARGTFLIPMLVLAPATMAAAPARAQAPADTVVRLVTVAGGNEARYRVREQLARIEFPSDAVGVTTGLEGAIVLDAAGRVVAEASRFTVDLTSLASDSERRDNYLRRRTLQTAQYPVATLVPRELRGATWPLPADDTTFELVGDLTLHGITKPTVWRVVARLEDGAVVGRATTSLRFGDFGMPIPRVAAVLSVTDEIRLEYDFRLVPASRP